MAITGRPTPGGVGALQHVHNAGERRVGRKWIPVAQRLQLAAKLIFEIMRHAGQRVTLLDSQQIGTVFTAAGEPKRLELDRLHLVNILRRELDNLTDAIVVDCVHDGGDERDFDSNLREILNCLLLHIKQVAHAAVSVLFFANPVELKIHAVLSRSLRRFAKLDVFSEAYAVGCRQNSVEADLLRVSNRLEIVRRKCRLAARKKNNDLAFWFERYRAIENRFCVFVSRLVHITNLVCIHEAGIAHHVAAIGKVHGQDGAAAKFDVRSAMSMDVRIVSRAKVASEEERFDPLEKRGVSCHNVNKLAMLRTVLAHDYLSVFFHDLCFDFARMLIHQRFEGSFAADDGVANFLNTAGTKTVGLAWEAERWRGALVGFQQWARGPFGTDRFALRK